MDGWLSYTLLFVAGCAAGVLNVLAGGGSFLTLPLLIFAGLPATVANGTNRVAIVLQSIGAVWGFHRYEVLDWRSVLWAALPATLGSVLGTWAALLVPDTAFKKILAVLMVGITLWTLWDPLGSRLAGPAASLSPRLALGSAFFLAGIYGGFVQAGVGFFLLAATTMAGLDLVKGNAVKVLTVLVLTSVSMLIFAWHGKIHWPMGLALATGTLLGGLLGVRLTMLMGHTWVRRVVTVTIIAFAVKLWLES